MLLMWVCLGDLASAPTPTRYEFHHIEVDDGLPNGVVRTVYQDRKGFIWIGTDAGLVRYDGYSFEIFLNEFMDRVYSPGNIILDLAEDQNGRLIAGTQAGLIILDTNTEKVKHYKPIEGDSTSLSDRWVENILVDSKNRIWAATNQGLHLLNEDEQGFTKFPSFSSAKIFTGAIAMSLIEDEEGFIWLTSNKGFLYKFNPDDGSVQKFAFPENQKLEVISLLKDNYGTIWLGTLGQGIWTFNTTTKAFSPFQVEWKNGNLKVVRDFLEASDGRIWMALDGNGIAMHDPVTKETSYLRFDPYMENGLNTDQLYSLYEDRDGNIWAGTFRKGINLFSVNKKQFITYRAIAGKSRSLSNNSVMSMLENDDGRIWVATDGGGLDLFDPRTEEFLHFKYSEKDPYSISSNVITAVASDHNGLIWLGTWQGGANLFNPKTGRSKRFYHDPDDAKTIAANDVWSALVDSENNIWLGTFNAGLDRYDPVKNVFIHYTGGDKDPSILGCILFKMLEDDDGTLWIATDKGLFQFDPKSERFTRYVNDKDDPNSIPGNDVRAIYFDENGTFWIGTNQGICQFDREKRHFVSLDINDQLKNKAIYGLLSDKNNNLWIGSKGGLARYNLITRELRNFDKSDGIQGANFNSNSSIYTKDGLMFFGGVNGMTMFDPLNIRDNQIVPPVYIRSLYIFDQEIGIGDTLDGRVLLPQALYTMPTIELEYRQNFKVTFASLDYTSSLKNQYRYKLEGYNSDWVYTSSNNRIASYMNLDPGEYRLIVGGTNSDGVWSPHEHSININIKPPWYMIGWVRVLALVFLVGSLVIAYKMRTNMLKRRSVELANLVREKTREIRDKNERLESLNQDLIESLHQKSKTLKQLRQTQNQLIESEKMASVGHLVAGLAHELNNPMSFIKGVVEPIKMDVMELKSLLPEELKVAHQELLSELQILTSGMEEGVVKASTIIKNLMDISPLNANKEESKICVKELISNASKSINLPPDIVNVSLPSSEEITILGNQMELNQALANVIRNSVDAIPMGAIGQINIKGYRENGHVIIEVEDNGFGMDKSTVSQVFDPFFTTKEPGKGKGLGLYIAYGIVKKHGGEIFVTSQQGIGTKFTLMLPPAPENTD